MLIIIRYTSLVICFVELISITPQICIFIIKVYRKYLIKMKIRMYCQTLSTEFFKTFNSQQENGMQL